MGHLSCFTYVHDISRETHSIDFVPEVREFIDIFPTNIPSLPLERDIYFPKIELRSNYLQWRIKVVDDRKTTFRTRYDYYKFLVMWFGLINILAAFMHSRTQVLGPYLDS